MSWTITTVIPIRWAACLAAAVAFAPTAAASVSDFRLPPAPAEQQPPPDIQGPVAPDVPESRPRPAPSPTPTDPPTSAITVPRVLPRAADDRRSPQTAPRQAPSTDRPGDGPRATAAASAPSTTEVTSEPPSNAPWVSAEPSLSPAGPLPSVSEEQGASGWLWALLGLAVVGVLSFAGWTWRQRQGPGAPLAVPEIERPRVAPAPSSASPAGQPTPAPVLGAETVEPLQVTLEPLRLSLTLINATLTYRLEVANRGAAPVEALHIGADMISAHASMSREEQLSGPARAAATVQRIERLEPGECRIVEGEFRLPFPQIVPIRQGKAALLLPLARFRLETRGAAPVVRTFVVGQPGAAAGLQPFRLDLGPRVYPKLAQHAFT